MRVVPTHGTLHGEGGLKCPPEPFLEVSDAEGARLIGLGAAKEHTEDHAFSAVEVFSLDNQDHPEGVIRMDEPVVEPEAEAESLEAGEEKIENAEAEALEQASVGAEGAASGEAAPAAASEATSASDEEGDDEEHGDPPADTPEENARLKDVAEHVELLTEDDFVKTGPRAGKPKVAPLAAACGYEDLSAEEVDAAFALHEAGKTSE